ncbi:uncharacterized protein SCHCODRAFT_02665777 [Schizophyllum commune H4-8]|nr:uncharacterized protein SCHCODRAFT_02665777 [Schizophyllum commune H4-8]KAI5895436.1 hypothetical protein SCHCODRAFT_02665777 [Schizophyllum commune H4-8]
MSFLLAGAWDQAYGWNSLTADERTTIKSECVNAGIKLIVAVFGAATGPPLQLRSDLPAGDCIVPHARGGGGYLAVNEKVGDLIGWNNIQFYNRALPSLSSPPLFSPPALLFPISSFFCASNTTSFTEYTSCYSLPNTSSSTWPESALFEIITNNVDADKLVIVKPATSGDAKYEYIALETLAKCLQSAKAAGWRATTVSFFVTRTLQGTDSSNVCKR